MTLNGKFLGGRAERFHITANELTVERDPVRARTIKGQDDFAVPPRQFVFQHPAQLHLQCVGIGWQSKVKIEKTMIHRFERQRKSQLGMDLPSDLRESRHGAKWHRFDRKSTRLNSSH